ncbi:hypothetical protein EN932_32180 [Mesorhizobium sp. M7A.F.Ca.US.002.01.1.1]|uniref:hypothetical protein n=1 Tax=Mesorhizobium sp. M7A.F.Ca.US.002.01.1.1 TaxID=2496700 RepID=UPI000FD19BA3|nr:hypothetical protein [Mesorhizobium sp. M7A.F.Ca.US.002.01.1.1]RVA03349.1 hypothetical protein EN932_32180 [Mesorhizobium sp. M7A.F.Ca.US.002.01.1.1]
MTDIALPLERGNWAWLRSPRFDISFILGLPALAFLTGLVIVWQPRFFYPILVFDLWFLGYHHVIATYTRLCFDRKSFAEHWPLLVILLPAVTVGTLAVAYGFGLWTIVSVYFYWQWFHYTRQSWGISRAFRGKQRDALYEDGWLDQAIFYALPILGILYRSHQDPGLFLGMELRVVPVASIVVQAVAAVTVVLLLFWLARRFQAVRQGRLALVHTIYMATHFAVFAVAYLVITDVTLGWLVINMWHNAQYVLFVWMFNTRRFKDGVDPEAPFLSYISQPGRLWLYMTTCILITGVLYWAVLGTLDVLFFTGLSMTIVLYQIVNFHHYIVDSRIWKVRKVPIRRTLGLEG